MFQGTWKKEKPLGAGWGGSLLSKLMCVSEVPSKKDLGVNAGIL